MPMFTQQHTRARRSSLRKARFKALPIVSAAALLLGATGLAGAQAGSEAGSASQSNPEVPGKVAPPSPSTSPEVTGTHDGVITPKRDVDPDMSKKPPPTGT